VNIKERPPSIADAASSRRASAKPRDGAEVAPNIRDRKTSPTRIRWSEKGIRGGMSAGGAVSRSRLVGGSGAPWLDRAKPNAAARTSTAIAVESGRGRSEWRDFPFAPQLDLSAAARQTPRNISPDAMYGTIDGIAARMTTPRINL
jgi:hypothetical protein